MFGKLENWEIENLTIEEITLWRSIIKLQTMYPQCRRDSSIMHRFTINSSPSMTEDITINNRLEVEKLIVKV